MSLSQTLGNVWAAFLLSVGLQQGNAVYFIMSIRQSRISFTEFLSKERLKCLLDYVDNCFLPQVQLFESIILFDLPMDP